uniref:Serpentine receptor class gamma n=1 Tax=Rhabditophanes sp. KR3021 TaxID=114890 RepID=A0AC35TII7_9BILA
MFYDNWQDILFFAFEHFTILFYVSVLICMMNLTYKSKKGDESSNHFYWHFTMNGVFDILYIFVNSYMAEYIQINVFFQWINTNDWARKIFMFGLGAFISASFVGNLYIVASRFISMHFPIYYHRIWKRRTVLILLVLQVIVPFGANYHMLFAKSTAKYINETGRYLYQMSDPTISWRNTYILLSFSAISSILGLIFSVINIIKFKSILSNQQNRKEIKKILFYVVYSVILSIGVFTYATLYTLRLYYLVVSNSEARGVVTTYINYSGVVVTFVHPYAVLFMHSIFRQSYLHFLGVKKNNSVNGTTIMAKSFVRSDKVTRSVNIG